MDMQILVMYQVKRTHTSLSLNILFGMFTVVGILVRVHSTIVFGRALIAMLI